MKRIGLGATLAIALSLTLGAGTALAGGGVKNGNFRGGDFSKWKLIEDASQEWRL